MHFAQRVLTELEKDSRMEGATRLGLADFLRQHQTLLDAAADDVRQAFFKALEKGDATAAWEALSANLSSAQILDHLRATEVEFVTLTAARQRALAQFQAALESAGEAALGLLAKAAFALL